MESESQAFGAYVNDIERFSLEEKGKERWILSLLLFERDEQRD